MDKELKTEVWVLLAKYLTNEASENERLEVEAILRQYPHVREDFKKLLGTYYLNSPVEVVDASASFARLNKRINRA